MHTVFSSILAVAPLVHHLRWSSESLDCSALLLPSYSTLLLYSLLSLHISKAVIVFVLEVTAYSISNLRKPFQLLQIFNRPILLLFSLFI
ncbi:hypothetical protein K1719_011037 [Acacia pycnantha]|nr:hypothetical protein K1719_011037 [Acacia pycnantha]